MKKYLLIILNLFFINTSCMEQTKSAPLNIRTIENQASFDSFFNDLVLKKEANQVLAGKDNYSSSKQENFIILCILPIDVLKKIIFDYLVNTDPEITDEKEIYKNFKKLALTCKFFANLSKPIMAQIVLISDKKINNQLKKLLTPIQTEPDYYKNIITSKIACTDWLVAVEQNRELWLTKNMNKIKRHNEADPRDLVEFGMLIAAENNNLAAAKLLLLVGAKENNKIISLKSLDLSRLIWLGATPLYIAAENLNVNLLKILLEDANYKKCINRQNPNGLTTPLSCTAVILHNKLNSDDKESSEKAIEIIRLLIQNGAKNKACNSYAKPKEFIPNTLDCFKRQKRDPKVLEKLEKLINEFPNFFKMKNAK